MERLARNKHSSLLRKLVNYGRKKFHIIVTSWGVCNTDEIGWESGTIDFYPYHFLFPKGNDASGRPDGFSFAVYGFCDCSGATTFSTTTFSTITLSLKGLFTILSIHDTRYT